VKSQQQLKNGTLTGCSEMAKSFIRFEKAREKKIKETGKKNKNLTRSRRGQRLQPFCQQEQ
jgi:hypothetical protein